MSDRRSSVAFHGLMMQLGAAGCEWVTSDKAVCLVGGLDFVSVSKHAPLK